LKSQNYFKEVLYENGKRYEKAEIFEEFEGFSIHLNESKKVTKS
jgi:hypothetical protein